MPSQWVLSAWAHRRELQENLRQAEAQVESLRESVDEAQAAVHAALVASEAARTALDDAESTHQLLHQQLSSLQLVFDPEVVAALPVEMLQAIFRELAFEHDPFWSVLHEGRYNPMRARVPWRLAGVCRKWRRVAFDMPEIWSYIATPTVSVNNPTSATWEKLVARMKLLLERSTTRALDILLVCDDPQCRLKDLDWVKEAVNVISLCASRWRRVRLALPRDVGESDLVFLRQPTPLLEEISVSVDNSAVPWKERYPAYLPSCPSLRTLWMSAVFTPPQSPLSLLTCAHLVVDDECQHRLWNALVQMQFLERLSIEFLWADNAPLPTLTPTAHLRLCRLQCLELSHFPAMVETWSQALEMPLLTKLVLRIFSAVEINHIATFLSVACAGVADLHIGSPDAKESILDIPNMPPVFRRFPELERVTFFDCTISTATMDQLNEPSQPAWPRLKSLAVERPAPGDWLEHFARALIRFVGFRVPTRHYNSVGHAPLTLAITGIDVQSLNEHYDLASSLRTLEYVLGTQNCRFTAATGETLPADADSDREESEETEAVLTESDADDSEGEGSESSEEDAEDDGGDSDWEMDDEPSEPEQLLAVSGPRWDSDQSDDGDYLASDESDGDSEGVSEKGSSTSDD